MTRIEKGAKYTERWFKSATLEELYKERRIIELDHGNPELELDYRCKCRELLNIFDNEIGKRKRAGKEYGYPRVKNWHLPSDD